MAEKSLRNVMTRIEIDRCSPAEQDSESGDTGTGWYGKYFVHEENKSSLIEAMALFCAKASTWPSAAILCGLVPAYLLRSICADIIHS